MRGGYPLALGQRGIHFREDIRCSIVEDSPDQQIRQLAAVEGAMISSNSTAGSSLQ